MTHTTAKSLLTYAKIVVLLNAPGIYLLKVNNGNTTKKCNLP